MKYMLLIYNNRAKVEALPEEEQKALMAEVDSLMAELTKSGELVGGDALADGAQAKTVLVREGIRTVTDGPFIEAKEHLAGYLMVETESEDRAIEIAAQWPDAKFGAMEVRAVIGTAEV